MIFYIQIIYYGIFNNPINEKEIRAILDKNRKMIKKEVNNFIESLKLNESILSFNLKNIHFQAILIFFQIYVCSP